MLFIIYEKHVNSSLKQCVSDKASNTSDALRDDNLIRQANLGSGWNTFRLCKTVNYTTVEQNKYISCYS